MEEVKIESEDQPTASNEQQEAEKAYKEVTDRLEKCRNSDEVLSNFALEAAKIWVKEMYFAAKSQDRLKAAQNVIHQIQGKPVERILNLTAKIGEYTDHELDGEITKLYAELGLGKKRQRAITSPSSNQKNRTR